MEDVADSLAFYFDADVPTPVSMADWEAARKQLAYYGNIYSTLCGYSAFLAVAIRRAKKATDEYTVLAAKRDLVSEARDAIGKKYDTVSRGFTMYSEEKERIK